VFAPLSALLVTVSVANCETTLTLVALLSFVALLSLDAATVAVIDDVAGDDVAVTVTSTLPESLVVNDAALQSTVVVVFEQVIAPPDVIDAIVALVIDACIIMPVAVAVPAFDSAIV
jgi:hypothetical protein